MREGTITSVLFHECLNCEEATCVGCSIINDLVGGNMYTEKWAYKGKDHVHTDKKKEAKKTGAWDRQEAGGHYKNMSIQPMEYSMANGFNSLQHTAIKYISRYDSKNGVEDLKKAIHCIEMLVEYEEEREEEKKSEDI